jgi:hypothetical protein
MSQNRTFGGQCIARQARLSSTPSRQGGNTGDDPATAVPRWNHLARTRGTATTGIMTRRPDRGAFLSPAVGGGYVSGYGQLTLAMVRTRCCVGCSELVY